MITLVGHFFDPSRPTKVRTSVAAPNISYTLTSDLVPAFLVQDDASGPFVSMEMFDITLIEDLGSAELIPFIINGSVSVDDIRHARRDFDARTIALFNRTANSCQWYTFPHSFIVPLPPSVALPANVAETKTLGVLDFIYATSGGEYPKFPLIFRAYLALSNKYKARRVRGCGLLTETRKPLRQVPMPKWVWITEISFPDSYKSTDPATRVLAGEVVHDGAGNPYAVDFVALHLGKLGSQMPPRCSSIEEASWALTSRWQPKRGLHREARRSQNALVTSPPSLPLHT